MAKNRVVQNWILVLSSWYFYGYWDWRFLGLLLFSSFLDYSIGRELGKTSVAWKRKLLLALSFSGNIGVLIYFKYFGFFLDNLEIVLQKLGFAHALPNLSIILPLGISFYTFQTFSYTLDIYKNRLAPEKSLLSFLCFVSFFPQLVAGPIEKAKTMLPQFNRSRVFNYADAVQGARLILWGLFLKVFISLKLAKPVDLVYGNLDEAGGPLLILVQFFFYAQLYCDFAGYSYIALGLGKFMGFQLSYNFKYPLLSNNLQKFWSSWHITLNQWFRDYLVVPLMLKYRSQGASLLIIQLNLLLIGVWHGANWTFIACFGLISIYYLIKCGDHESRRPFKKLGGTVVSILTFQLFIAAHMVFFRSKNIGHALDYFKSILDPNNLTPLKLGSYPLILLPLLLLVGLVLIEFFSHKRFNYPLEQIQKIGLVRYVFYFVMFYAIVANIDAMQPFIYFDF